MQEQACKIAQNLSFIGKSETVSRIKVFTRLIKIHTAPAVSEDSMAASEAAVYVLEVLKEEMGVVYLGTPDSMHVLRSPTCEVYPWTPEDAVILEDVVTYLASMRFSTTKVDADRIAAKYNV